MIITAQNTPVQSCHHSISCLVKKTTLPTNIILQTNVDPPGGTHKQYLENWKEVTEDAYETALQNSIQEGK